MRSFTATLVFCGLAFTFSYCTSDETSDTSVQGPPKWESGFPSVAHGATSIEIVSKLNQPGKIYYIISTSKESLTSATVKTLAENGGATIIKKGILTYSTQESPLTEKIPALMENQTYFLYLVTESNTIDTVLEASPKSYDLILPKRQVEEKYKTIFTNAVGHYYAYRPEEYYYQTSKKFPLLIFVHGNGSKGTSLTDIFNGPPKLINQGVSYPFVTISPQINAGDWSPDLLNEILTHVQDSFRIDEKRIYMTGTSLGAMGIWNYAITYPDNLTAIVPISGDGNEGQACKMRNIAVWAFHNEGDNTVKSSGSISMVNSLNMCNPPPREKARLTIYPGTAHDAWTKTYNGSEGHDIFFWLLKQSKL